MITLEEEVTTFLESNPQLVDEYYDGHSNKQNAVDLFYDDSYFARFVLSAMAEADQRKKDDDLSRYQ